MPAIPSGSKMLVTGANGFIAIWVVRSLLEHGFSVRGTVRSPAKGEHVKKTFASYGDKLEIIVVPDITSDGAFDEAVKDIDAIAHLAAPYHFNAVDPEEMFQPAVQGTISVMKSSLKCGPRVKRIIVTSSCAAVMRPTETPLILNEDDWNEPFLEIVAAQGKDAPSFMKYFAAKVAGEKAAFKFFEDHKNEISWDLVTLCPPYVTGPVINEASCASSANQTICDLHSTLVKGSMDNATLTSQGNGWMDVRDVAKAHLRAIQREEAVGRFIISAGLFKWQDWVNTARSLKPQPYTQHLIIEGDQSYDAEKAVHLYTYDLTRMERDLGLAKSELISMEQSTRDMLEDWQRRGW